MTFKFERLDVWHLALDYIFRKALAPSTIREELTLYETDEL